MAKEQLTFAVQKKLRTVMVSCHQCDDLPQGETVVRLIRMRDDGEELCAAGHPLTRLDCQISDRSEVRQPDQRVVGECCREFAELSKLDPERILPEVKLRGVGHWMYIVEIVDEKQQLFLHFCMYLVPIIYSHCGAYTTIDVLGVKPQDVPLFIRQ